MNRFSSYKSQLDTRSFRSGNEVAHICSFTEFYPFCKELSYFSTFKDFNTHPQAWIKPGLGSDFQNQHWGLNTYMTRVMLNAVVATTEYLYEFGIEPHSLRYAR